MILVESLLYKIDQNLNKVATLDHQEIPLEDKILALNQAQLELIKVKLNPNNPLGLGLDSFKKRYEDLEILIEPASPHELSTTLRDAYINRWEADLTVLDPKYMFYIDSYALADKGNCKNKVIYVNQDLSKHADVITLLTNSSYKPSFEYEETFCTISKMKLELYTDGTFDFTKVFVSYIRYPQKIDFPGYTYFDGTASVRSDSELPGYLEDELLNLTVRQLAMNTENVPAVQFTSERIRTSE